MTQALPHAWQPYAILITMFGFAAALWATGTSDAPVDGVLYRENVGHRRRLEELEAQHAEIERYKTDAEQHESAIQTLASDNTALRSTITLVISSDINIARRNLEVSNTLRNRVLLLVAELREIPNRIPIYTHYEHPSVERMHWHQRQELGRQMMYMHYAPIWKQYWEIYHTDFDKRVRALVNDLQQASAASDKLIGYPATVGSNELNHSLPTSLGDYLIPELLSAADALTRSQSSLSDRNTYEHSRSFRDRD
jgi:hypothetical protein